MFEAIKNLFKKKHPQNNHYFSEEERELSAIKRTTKAEMVKLQFELQKLKLEEEKLMQEARIEKLRNRLFPEEEEGFNPEELLMQIFMGKLQASQAQSTLSSGVTTPTPVIPEPMGISLSEDVLRSYIGQIPKPMLKKLKSMSEDQLRTLAIEKFPQASRETVEKAVQLMKSA